MEDGEISKKKAIIVIHESGWGPGHDLRDYLNKKKIKKLLFVAHPLLYLPDNFKNSSRYELYERGRLLKSGNALHWQFPEPILYIKDTLYSIYWSYLYIGKNNVFVGVGNLNAFAGLCTKLLGMSPKVIYYVIDYVPNRFSNMVLNTLYHSIERIAAGYCSWTWNLSPRMIEGREKKWEKKFPHQLVVPHGVHSGRIRKVAYENINKREVLFMGVLLKKQGIQLLIQVLPQILKKLPNVTVTIIGRGPYEAELKKLAVKLSLKKHISFLGYVQDHEEMENRMAKAAVAIALYNRKLDINDFTYYADPGKIKNYLGAGVPVIMTDVPYIARELVDARCGFIVSYSKKDLIKTLVDFLKDEGKMRDYRKNALSFAKKYNWENVFAHALARSN